MKLVPIGQHGEVPKEVQLDDHLRMVIEMTIRHFNESGYVPPWISYLAMGNSGPVGSCAFKSAPVDGRVEIAYGTRPGYEGQGVATAMAKNLVRIAQQEDPNVIVFAQTLPEENASTSILKKLGFQMVGTVDHPDDGLVREWELPVNVPMLGSESA